MPMAVKYVIAWITAIVSFLAKVWSDARFSEEACAALTRWVGEEFIPSCPRGLWYHETGHNVARGERLSVFSIAMVQFSGITDLGRANRALRTLAESLGISDDQYLVATADTIRASMDKEEALGAEREEEKAFSHIMMQNALFHVIDGHLDALAFSRFRALGLFRDVASPPLPGALIGLLREASQSPGTCVGEGGRLVFVREEKSASAIDVNSILLHPQTELRQAAFDYLSTAGKSANPWLTPYTLEVLAQASADIASEDERRWRSAAIAAADVVRQDVLALLASFRQALVWKYQEGIDEYLDGIMHPSFLNLVHFRPPVWNPSDQRGEIKSWILDLSKLPALDDALTGYMSRCGYVPLSHELSASLLVTEWITAHPDVTVSWAVVWEWALRQGTPAARYHAITVALHVPQVRPVGDWERFWTEAVSILNVRDSDEQSTPSDARWQLSCELASHFAHHLEALHPAQHGDSVACYYPGTEEAHTNPTRQRGECLRALAGASG